VGTYEDLIPTADLVCNLTPDKQHTAVVTAIMPLMKGSTYSHGFNIVEEGMQIRTLHYYVLQNVLDPKYE
jgi:ketol-acid reductoisomerase